MISAPSFIAAKVVSAACSLFGGSTTANPSFLSEAKNVFSCSLPFRAMRSRSASSSGQHLATQACGAAYSLGSLDLGGADLEARALWSAYQRSIHDGNSPSRNTVRSDGEYSR